MNCSLTANPVDQTSGTYQLPVVVWDSSAPAQYISQTLTITIKPGIELAPYLLDGTVFQPYSDHLYVAAGGTAPYTFSITSGALPPGLELDGNTGAISGTPTIPGTYSFTAAVKDSTGLSGSQLFSLQVAGLTLSITPNTMALPVGRVGVTYAPITFTPQAGVGPYTFSQVTGSTPGLSFDSQKGVLSGTPTTAGSYILQFLVTDQIGDVGAFSFQITVQGIVPTTLIDGYVGNLYISQFFNYGFSNAWTVSIVSGTLPPGISFSSAIVAPSESNRFYLTGTPTQPGTFNFTVEAQDPGGVPLDQPFTLRISPPVLAVNMTHSGSFLQGQIGATYTITVSNVSNLYPTVGTVTLTEMVPVGLTLVSMAGTGWTCPGTSANTCTRSDALAAGASYPAITVTVNVAGNATSPQINSAGASGGGATAASFNDPTTIVAAVPPAVHIDAPASGAVVAGTITIAGWAIDNTTSIGSAIGSVLVSVDGGPATAATYGISRADVCAAWPGRAGCPNVGFSYQLNTGALSPGSHTLIVTATNTSSPPVTGSASITVQAVGVPFVQIDTPVAGSTASGTLTIAGWAIDNLTSVGTAIGKVQVSVDGNVVGNAAYGWSRADVCASWPGRPGCPNVGFSYQLDTTALGAGLHTITVSAIDTVTPPDVGSASTTINVSYGPPAVHIDSPSPGTMLTGTVTVAGWAIDNTTRIGSAINSVQVKVDGVTVGTATYGVPRPDVCTAWPGRSGCPNVGFAYQLNTATLSPGAHSLTVVATDSDTTPDSASETFSFQVTGPPSVDIDAPGPAATVSGTVTIAGWAIDNTSTIGSAISKVQVFVDGTLAGNAIYGISRPDVCALWPGRPGCPNVGYTYQWNTSALAAGQHTITVSATDSDGTPDSGTAGITVTVSDSPPTVVIDSPHAAAVVSGSTMISGWALDSAGRIGTAISSVKVQVDGVVVGNATYGSSRPDVCAAYAGRPGCPNVGFTYALNTLTLTAGVHTITVSAVDSDGIPDVGSASVSITVLETPPTVYIDAPAPGAIVSGVVAVGGWAIDTATSIGTAIGNVQIEVDGVLVGSAIYGTLRSDVCSAWPGRPGCPNVGFMYSLNTAGLSMGSHTLTAVATDTDGTPLSSAWTIIFQVTGPPTVAIDAPRPGSTVSGIVTVAGWAIDSASSAEGTAITSVQVKVDGISVGTADYGGSRPDVCAAFPARSGCPNVGFSFAWNTATLAAGSHTITVSATDSDGTPDTGSASITVVK